MISDNPALGAVYFDNAATRWPKPPGVLEAHGVHTWRTLGGSPGRAGHECPLAPVALVNDTRDELAELLGIPDPCRLAFTKNSTEALNIAIMGILGEGDHAICTSMEHNSVMRPLRYLEQRGSHRPDRCRCSPRRVS